MLQQVISRAIDKEVLTDVRDGEPSDVRKTRVPIKEKTYEAQKTAAATKKSAVLPKEKDQAVVKEKTKSDKKSGQVAVEIPLEDKSNLASDGQPPKRTVLVSSKPIPPSLGGNSPFLEKVAENVTEDSTEKPDDGATEPSLESAKAQQTASGLVTDSTDNYGNGTVSEIPVDDEEELPERPNRGRLLVRPQHHTFYPYFLNRVLG